MASSREVLIIIDVADRTNGKLDNLKRSLLAVDKAITQTRAKLASLGNRTYNATIRLVDRLTPQGSKINAFLKSIASKTYTITAKMGDAIFGKIRSLEASLMRIAGRAYTVAVNLKDNVSGKIKGIADGALMGVGGMGLGLMGGAGIGYGAVNAAQAYMNFEKQMSKVQAVAMLDKSSPEMQMLTQQAKDLGASTAWTREQVGQAQFFQAMAGWSPELIQKATPAILNLASAGATDLATTSDIVTDTLTGFQIRADETYRDSQGRYVNAAEHYADIMAKLVTSANTDIPQLGEALKYSSNVVGAMYADKDIQTRMHAAEDAMVMTGLMASAGIKSSMAGTTTRAVFSRFGSENRNAYFGLQALGVDFKDANGEVRRIRDIFHDLNQRFSQGVSAEGIAEFAEMMTETKLHADTRRKLTSFMESVQKNGGKMTGADKLKLSSMLAGQEAMSGFMAAIMGDWDALGEKIDNAHGAAQAMAEIQLDNLSGSLTLLGSAWDAFQQGFFEGGAGDGIRAFVDSLTEVISRANELFKDGIQVGDIGKLIADVVDRLKNKFMELDGIGSILAGGALMAAFVKIGRAVQKVIGYIGQLKGLQIGQMLGGATGAKGGTVSAAASVGTMNVTAGVVNIAGKAGGVGGAAGGRRVGNTAIIDNYNATKERIRGTGAPPPPSMRSTFMSGAKGGAAFAAMFGALDFFNNKSMSAERAKEAADALNLARSEYQELVRLNRPAEELAQHAADIQKLQAEQTQILQDNKLAERDALAGATGSVLGAAIGAGLGSFIGPLGTMIGGMIGGMIGDKGGRMFNEIETPNQDMVKPASDVSQDVVESKTAEMLGVKKDEQNYAFKEIEDLGWTGKTPISYLTDKREGQNFFGYNGEDILGAYDRYNGYTPPTQAERDLSVLGYGHGRNKPGTTNELANFEAETERMRLESEQRQRERWLASGGRWQGQTPQQTFDPTQMGREALESTTSHFQEQRRANAPAETITESITPTSGTSLNQPTEYTSPVTPILTEPVTIPPLDTSAFEESSMQATTLAETLGEIFNGLGESIGETFSGLGELITETLGSAFEGVGETFSTFTESIGEGFTSAFESASEMISGFGELIGEGLTGAFEVAGEMVSTFGATLGEGLTAALEGASEMFTGFGELVSSALAAAQGAAESALASIGSAFESARSSIMSAWGELPGFFSGIFDGLGGVAAAAGSAIYSGLTSVIGAVIGAWQSAAATVSSIISSISAKASSIGSMLPSIGGGGSAYAEGGFVNSPTQALIGEAGAEVVIPLSSSKRSRAIDLFNKTAAILGEGAAIPMSDFTADDIPELTNTFSGYSIDAPTPVATKESTSAKSEVSMGGINVTFNISGADSPQQIMDTIKENLADIADKIAGRLGDTVLDSFNNMALKH